MGAIVYKNTKTSIPGWVDTLHLDHPMGFAYKQDNYYVHIYGRLNGLWALSPGLTASQKITNEPLNDWAVKVFGAEDIKVTNNNPGETIEGIWRPGLYYQEEVLQALKTNEYEQRTTEQALRILIEKLDDLLLYIEPNANSLMAFSHKTRELLILACTEAENTWTKYMTISGVKPTYKDFCTKDYVKLLLPLFLDEYEIKVKPYKSINPIRPFSGWNQTAPTQSLSWYHAYSKTKHDRELYFGEATLINCIQAVAANIVLFCIRFSPYPLFQGANSLSGLVNHLFSIELTNPDPTTFYIPKMELRDQRRPSLVCGDATKLTTSWLSKQIVL